MLHHLERMLDRYMHEMGNILSKPPARKQAKEKPKRT
jgi:hypothetical protein